MSNKIDVLNYKIDYRLPDFNFGLKRRYVFATINPHSYYISKKDSDFRKALVNADSLLPDGIGFVFAVKLLSYKSISRITGSDLHLELLRYLNDIKGKVFYLGSSPSTLIMIQNKLILQYPNITIDSYSPPYKEVFSENENGEILRRINLSKSDVLFVGMTAPKQEKWVFKNKDSLDIQVIASIGAVFDFYAGNIKRSGFFWQKIGLEWLPRLIQEPRRLWKRTFISLPVFLFDVLLHFILRRPKID